MFDDKIAARPIPGGVDPRTVVRAGDLNDIKARITGWLNVLEYGADPTGATDSTAAIQAAIAAAGSGGHVRLPPGTYVVSSTSTITAPVTLEGAGAGTIIRPSAALSGPAFLVNNPSSANMPWVTFRALRIDGQDTTNAIGIRAGSTGTTGRLRLDNVQILRFTGTGGRGLAIDQVVWFTAYDSSFEGSYVNVAIGETLSDFSMPTIVRFYSCSFRSAVTKGVRIWVGYGIQFYAPRFESNQEEGLYVSCTGHSVYGLVVEDQWSENNWAGNGAQATKFQSYFIALSGATVSPEIRRGYFSSSSLGIYVNQVVDTVIDNVWLPNAVGSVTIEGSSASGSILNWRANNSGALLTNVVWSGGGVQGKWWLSPHTGRPYTYPQPTGRIVLTYSATLAIDASLGSVFDVAATNATDFTFSTPTNPTTGQRITVRVRNYSGGALSGTNPFPSTAGWRLSSTAWTQPSATGSKSCTIDFEYTGSVWREVGGRAIDVAD